MAFYDTIFNISVVADIYIIQNDGIFDDAVIADIALLENNGVFHSAVDNTSAGDQAVSHIGACVVFGRGQIVHLGINIRILLEEIIAHIGL